MQLLAHTNTTARPPKRPAGFNKGNKSNFTSTTLRTYSDLVRLRQNPINWVSTQNSQRKSKLQSHNVLQTLDNLSPH